MHDIDALRGKALLIGRHAGDDRLCVGIVGGKTPPVQVLMGAEGSVPRSVSRCKVAEKTAHCRLTVREDGSMMVENLKDSNLTYVGDIPVVSKQVGYEDALGLGSDRFSLSVGSVIEHVCEAMSRNARRAAEGGTSQQPRPVFPLDGLKPIWEEYDAAMMEIGRRQRRIGLIRSIPPVFTLGGLGMTVCATMMGLGNTLAAVSGIGTLVGLGVTLYGFWLNYRDRSLEERAALNESLQDRYVCPNPDCAYFMGQQPFRVIAKTRRCPRCGCDYTVNADASV